MRAMELSCITEVWRSALKLVGESLAEIGSDLQLWFPWGKVWRGHDLNGTLPPTNFPEELANGEMNRFGGRLWHPISVGKYFWLINIRAPKTAKMEIKETQISTKAIDALNMLGEFVRLESLLALSMRVLENRAKENSGHWDRVTSLSVAISQELGLSEAEIADIEIAAMLHDIGKVSLPDKILESPDSLSEEDRKKVEAHAVVGSTMVREGPGMDKIADYILFHHESPNGSGYPNGRSGDEIPLGALIISVADAFDAMTHYRPYATEHTYYESFEELKSVDGKYAPEVLDALEKVLTRLGILDSSPMVKDFSV